ncbi:hypothetical protein HY357_02410 [Candidatus Roizmanbacteria bacterium]|nr:hypothetical protein [Candidatus Roizmanbacteria bacterium]
MKEITTQELKKLISGKKKFILLDCRGVDYYLWEHLPGARNIRWKYVQNQASKIIPDKKTLIVTYCDGFTCSASIRCYKNLVKLGYKNILEYSGGIADWKAYGFETVRNSKYRIAENVYRFPNQTFYGEIVNSYLIEEEDFILLVDGPQQLTEEHEDFILYFDKPIKIFMSHGPTAGETKILKEQYEAKIYLHKKDSKNEWLTVKPDVLFENGFQFNDHLKVIHAPGHSPGSSVLYDARNQIMFTGDHVEGNKVGNVYDFFKDQDGTEGDVKKRFKSAKKLLNYNFEKILPFHYEMILTDAKDSLKKFIDRYL